MSLSAKVCRAELVGKLGVCALLKRQPRILPHGTLLEASENSLAVTVDNLEIALETLRSKGFHAINEDELKDTQWP